MHHRLKQSAAAALLVTGMTGATVARAEMGLSPTGPDRMYFTFFGGYVNSDGTATPGHGVTPGPSFAADLFEAENGGYGGVTAGFVFDGVSPFGLLNFRIETGFAVSDFDEKSSTPSGYLLTLNSLGTFGPNPISTVQSRKVHDWFVRFKGDKETAQDQGVAFGLELFFRQSDDDTTSIFTGGGNVGQLRSHDVDAFFAGVMAMVQPEYSITPTISAIADLSVGLYAVDAEARSRAVFIGTTRFNDSDGTVGFRTRAKGGLRFEATDMVSLTLFGGVDYWSDVPVADQKGIFGNPARLPNLKFKDLVELKAGLSLTVLLGGP